MSFWKDPLKQQRYGLEIMMKMMLELL